MFTVRNLRTDAKRTKPTEINDQFEVSNLPENTESQKKSVKKFLIGLIRYATERQSLEKPVNPDFYQIRHHFGKVKKLTIHIHFHFFDSDYPYYLQFTGGTIIPEFLHKNIMDCNFLDIRLMKLGLLTPKHKVTQLFTSIAIILATIIESLSSEKLDKKLSISEGLLRIEKDIETYPETMQDGIKEIFTFLDYSLDRYESLDFFNSIINDPHLLEKYPDFPEALLENANEYEDWLFDCSYYTLEYAINKAISCGLLKKYQRNPFNKKAKQLCANNSLLNNKKLLKKLNGQALNQEGNRQKSSHYNALTEKIISLILSAKQPYDFKSKSEAAEKLAESISAELEEFMRIHREEHNHNQRIKLENLPDKILEIINKNPEVKSKIKLK
ncbi:hypothetical protein [Acinetobacter puyangensis]|uniref:hypothetical protein n=1 Tax=Acinetobacter puyangensis TaxID=1096779 RepID=UPI003A4D79B3